MKTAVSLPDPLFEAGERLAQRLGISRSELFQRALGAYLRAEKDTGVTESLNEIYGPEGEESMLDPVLDALQRASLPQEDW